MADSLFSLNPTTSEGMFSIGQIVEENQKFKSDALRAAMMRSYNTGTEVVDEYNAVVSQVQSGGNIKDIQSVEQNSFLQERTKFLQEYVTNNITSQDPAERERVQAILSDFNGVRDSYLDEFDGAEQVFVDMYASENIDSLGRRKEAAYAKSVSAMEEYFADAGLLSKAGNFAADMLAPDDLKDINDLADMLGLTFTQLTEEMSDFQTRDPEDQLAIMAERMPLIIAAADDNMWVARNIMEMYFDPDVTSKVLMAGAFDALALVDVGLIGKGAMNLGLALSKRVGAKTSMAATLDRLDNVELSAAVNKAAAADATDGTLEVVGSARADAAASASPAKLNDVAVVTGQMDDVAAAYQDARKSTITRLWEDLVPIAASKVSRGQLKSWNRQKIKLQQEINTLKSHPGMKSKPHSKQSKAMRERIGLMQRQIDDLNKVIDDNVTAAAAHADLSRLEQGIIPARFQEVFTKTVQDELDKISRGAPNDAKASVLNDATNAKGGDSLAATDDLIELVEHPRMLDAPEEFGLSAEFADILRETVQIPLRRLGSSLEEQSIKALSPEDIKRVEDKVVATIKKRIESSGNNVNSLDILERSDKGFTVKYTLDDGAESTYTHNFTVSDSGTLVSKPELAKSNVTSGLRRVFSPDVVWREMLGGFVKNITYAGQQSARATNQLLSKWRALEQGVSKETKAQVDALLMVGDETGTVFTPRELLDGTVEFKAGTQGVKAKYTKEEVLHYFQKRAFFDELHNFRNKMTRDQLEFLGMRNVSYVDKQGVRRNMLGRQYDGLQGVDQGALDNALTLIPDNMTAGKASFVSNKKSVKAYIDKGYNLVRLMNPETIKNSATGKKVTKKVEFALVKDQNITRVPSQVLNYSAGYVPRIYKPGYFYVKDAGSLHNETLYAFEKRVDADKYAKQLNDGGENVVVKEDREFSDLEKLMNSSDMYGGLYTGHRKSNNIMVMGEDGKEFRPERLSVAGATQRYVQSVSSIMPINTYRMAMVEKWMNTVNMLAKATNRRGINKADGFDGLMDLEPAHLEMMNDSREYLRRVLSIPSDQESFFRDKMAKLGEVMRGKPGGDWVLNNIHADPVRAVKGLTFNAHMGWFNLRQLFVQAQNASIAISMHPTKAPAAIGRALAMRSAVYSNNPDVWRSVAKRIGLDPEEFVADLRLFRESGLIDSIARTADLDSNLNGLGTGSFEAVRRAAKAGRIFYEEGEVFSRLMAWNIAKSNLREQGAELSAKSLSDETVRMHMNLQAENAAHWQNTAIGVPTQFMQVFAKFAENMMPNILGGGTGKWTAKEKARVLAGQIALYGTIGVPLLDDTLAYVAELGDTSPAELQAKNPMLAEAVQEGLVGVLTQALGFDNNFSEAGSLLAGMDDNVVVELGGALIDYFSGDNDTASIFDVGLGASGNTALRTADAVGKTWDGLAAMFTTPAPATVGRQSLEILGAWGSITSTWNNARKAAYVQFYGQGLRSKRGTLLMTTEELGMDWPTFVARTFGFQTDRETALFAGFEYDMDSKKAKQDARQALREAYLEYARTGDLDLYRKRAGLLLGPYTPVVRQELNAAHLKEVLGNKSTFSKQVHKFTIDTIKNNGEAMLPSFTNETLDRKGQ